MELSPGITVTGIGEVTSEPDTGFIDLGVQVSRPAVAEARDVAAAAVARVIASLRANGIDAADARTTSLAITPEYDYSGDRSPRITGYQVTNMLTVRVRDLERFSAVVDDAVTAGGDDARLHGIRFSREDASAALAGARAAAMADARERARQLAELAGVELGAAIAIEEATDQPGPRPMFERAAMLSADATPIEPGATKVSVSVVVRFAISGRSG
jgi:uncharacterized protein YggE